MKSESNYPNKVYSVKQNIPLRSHSSFQEKLMILSAILSTLCGTSRGPALASLCYSNGRRLPAGCICTPAAPLALMSKRLIDTTYLLIKVFIIARKADVVASPGDNI